MGKIISCVMLGHSIPLIRSNREDDFDYFEDTVDFGYGITRTSRHSAKKWDLTCERERNGQRREGSNHRRHCVNVFCALCKQFDGGSCRARIEQIIHYLCHFAQKFPTKTQIMCNFANTICDLCFSVCSTLVKWYQK